MRREAGSTGSGDEMTVALGKQSGERCAIVICTMYQRQKWNDYHPVIENSFNVSSKQAWERTGMEQKVIVLDDMFIFLLYYLCMKDVNDGRWAEGNGWREEMFVLFSSNWE